MAEKRGKILWNCRENGVLGASQAKETQRSKNKTNTTQTSNNNKRTNKKKNNKNNKKNRQQTRDKNIDCCSKGWDSSTPPKKSSRGEFGPAIFSLVFKGKTRRRAQNPLFVFGLQNQWFREVAKNPPNRTGSDPKSVQKNAPYFQCKVRVCDPEKGRICNVLNGVSENLTFPIFKRQKNSDFKAATRPQCRYLRLTPRDPETPIKQARKRSGGNPLASGGPNPPSESTFGDQIPLLQHMCMYVFFLDGVGFCWANDCLLSMSGTNHVRNKPLNIKPTLLGGYVCLASLLAAGAAK